MTEEDKDELATREQQAGKDPEVVEELEEDLPAPPTIIRQMMAMFGFGLGGRAFHPVFDKFEPEHVDKFLDHSHEEDLERLRIRRQDRWFFLIYAVIGLGFLGWLIWALLPNDKDLLAEILKLGIAFAGGVGGGYGLKSYQESRRQDR